MPKGEFGGKLALLKAVGIWNRHRKCQGWCPGHMKDMDHEKILKKLAGGLCKLQLLMGNWEFLKIYLRSELCHVANIKWLVMHQRRLNGCN